MDLSEYPVVITLNVVGIRVKQRWAQTYERVPTFDPTTTNARGAFHSALCCLAVQTAFAGTFTTLMSSFTASITPEAEDVCTWYTTCMRHLKLGAAIVP